jgi:hypothetical protein
VYASWFTNHSSGATSGSVFGQAFVSGNPAFANASTWTVSDPNFPVPPFAYKTVSASSQGIAASAQQRLNAVPQSPRSFSLYPILAADTEQYVSYFIFESSQ